MHKNKVFLDEQGVIWNIYLGEQTPESVHNVGNKTVKIIEHEGVTVKGILVDNTNARFDEASTAQGYKETQRVNSHKIAFIGANRATKIAINLMSGALGTETTTRYFEQPKLAIIWLLA